MTRLVSIEDKKGEEGRNEAEIRRLERECHHPRSAKLATGQNLLVRSAFNSRKEKGRGERRKSPGPQRRRHLRRLAKITADSRASWFAGEKKKRERKEKMIEVVSRTASSKNGGLFEFQKFLETRR